MFQQNSPTGTVGNNFCAITPTPASAHLGAAPQGGGFGAAPQFGASPQLVGLYGIHGGLPPASSAPTWGQPGYSTHFIRAFGGTPALAYSNRDKNIDVCPSCYHKMAAAVKTVLALQPTHASLATQQPHLFCDCCREYMQADTKPRSRLGLLVDLRSAFEALPPSITQEAIDGLVDATIHGDPCSFTADIWKTNMEMGGFSPALVYRIVASLSRQSAGANNVTIPASGPWPNARNAPVPFRIPPVPVTAPPSFNLNSSGYQSNRPNPGPGWHGADGQPIPPGILGFGFSFGSDSGSGSGVFPAQQSQSPENPFQSQPRFGRGG